MLFNYILHFNSKVDKTELLVFYPVEFKIEKLTSKNDLVLNETTLYTGVKDNCIVQVTNNHINVYTLEFNLLKKISTIVSPILVKVKQNTCYIFNKNNILASYYFGGNKGKVFQYYIINHQYHFRN